MTDHPAPFPFHSLLSLLQAHGFWFGVDTRVRLSRYFQEISQEDLSPEILKFQLAALLSRSAEQQQKFFEIFENWLPEKLTEHRFLQKIEIPATPQEPLTTPSSPAEAIKTPVSGKQIPEPISPKNIPPTGFAGPVYPLLAFPDDPLRVWNLAKTSAALMPLQEKEWSDTAEWDLPATMRATIRSGGIPNFVFRKRKRAPRYLALIEQQSPRDHLAGFAAELVREINRRDLEAEFYFFEKSPSRCWKILRDPRTHVHLELLKSEWAGARLLLIGNAARFINPETGKPSNLALDLPDSWEKIALLATNSPLEWGAAERALGELFPVAPMSIKGLAGLMAFWNKTDAKSPGDWQLLQPEPVPPTLLATRSRTRDEITIDLFRYLGKNGFRWLAAAAVYPEIYFELTCLLHDEAIPKQSDLSEWQQNAIWHEALLLLSRLDWFRRGWLPEQMRSDLRQRLAPADLGTVETEIRRILDWSHNAVPPDSHAEAERREVFSWLGERLFRVLWIDDHPENNVALQARWTRDFGVVFQNASSLGEALPYIPIVSPTPVSLNIPKVFDLVISDIGRKGEESPGISTLQELRTRNAYLPIVFFTDKRGMNLRGKLMEAGAEEVTNQVAVLEKVLQEKIASKFSPKPEMNIPRQKKPLRKKQQKQQSPTSQNQASSTYTEYDNLLFQHQNSLKLLGYYNGEPDGILGDKTRSAIVAFQKDNGLVADGIIGRQTQSLLEEAKQRLQQQQTQESTPDIPDMWQELARSICKIVLPSGGHGTGFLTENGYIFTANYILPNAESARRAYAHFADPEGLAPYIYELDENDFVTNEGDVAFSRIKLKVGASDQPLLFSPLAILPEAPRSDEKAFLIFFGENSELVPEFSLDGSIFNVSEFDVMYDADTENGAGGAPVFNAAGQVVAIHHSKVDYQDLKRGILMKEVMWEIHARAGNPFVYWRGLTEKGYTAKVLDLLQQRFPYDERIGMLTGEYASLNKSLAENLITRNDYESRFRQIKERLAALIRELESRESSTQAL